MATMPPQNKLLRIRSASGPATPKQIYSEYAIRFYEQAVELLQCRCISPGSRYACRVTEEHAQKILNSAEPHVIDNVRAARINDDLPESFNLNGPITARAERLHKLTIDLFSLEGMQECSVSEISESWTEPALVKPYALARDKHFGVYRTEQKHFQEIRHTEHTATFNPRFLATIAKLNGVKPTQCILNYAGDYGRIVVTTQRKPESAIGAFMPLNPEY